MLTMYHLKEMMPATLALIRTFFTVERVRNLAFAIWGSLSVVGAALGPILGGTLLENFWWGCPRSRSRGSARARP